jgi:hypothetical protein
VAGRIGLGVAVERLAREDVEPMPPMRDAVPVKYRSTRSRSRPTASKICAPQ